MILKFSVGDNEEKTFWEKNDHILRFYASQSQLITGANEVSDKEWEERSKTRAMEIAAVGETIKILTDEDAHDLSLQ